MVPLSVILNGHTEAMPDLPNPYANHVTWTVLQGAIRIPGGMAGGASAINLRIDLPGGKVIMAQTSLALLNMAVRAFNARDEMEGTPNEHNGTAPVATRAPLEMFTVYEKPRDYPGKYVVRRWTVPMAGDLKPDPEPTCVADTIEEARRAIPAGKICIGNATFGVMEGDPCILETWV